MRLAWQDCGSSHGTYVNGLRIASGTAVAVRSADTVQLGRVAPVLLRIAPVLSSSSTAVQPSLRDLTSWHVLVAYPEARASPAAAPSGGRARSGARRRQRAENSA